MSSSGKGQSIVRSEAEIDAAWDYAQSGGRAGQGRCIVEGFVDFDYEITLLTVRHAGGTDFCAPIGHLQEARRLSRIVAAAADERGGAGRGAASGRRGHGRARRRRDSSASNFSSRAIAVIFSEVSPRPHDTGLVTLISQDLSEFALHARAILGLPIPLIRSSVRRRRAPCSPKATAIGRAITASPKRWPSRIRCCALFGKPEVRGHRRMAVTLARDADIESARAKARRAAAKLSFEL